MRWLYFLALALLAGGLGFRLLVLRGPLRPETERRFYRVLAVGAVGAIEVGIFAFLLRAEDALQLPFGRFLYGDLTPIAGGTRFGTAFVAMTLGFALVSALVFLAWLTDRTWLLWPAFALSLGIRLGPLALGPLRGRCRVVLALRSSPTGRTWPPRRSGSAGSCSSPSSSGRSSPSCGGAPSCASRASRRC